jgi:exodeoxyribonuclease VII large subunit
MSSRFPQRTYAVRRATPGRVSEPSLPFGEDGPAESAVTVSQFVARINGALRTALPDAWVKGEVGEWRVYPSGHAYFTLKDRFAVLNGMMWADDLARVPFRVDAGMELLARGRPDVYAKSGKLSFVVAEIQPAGVGALQLAFEQLKARLAAEGLFDTARKRPLPLLPRRIGIVTSRHGAAVRDILKVLSKRFPNAHVTIYPALVQGAGAAEAIARGVAAFSRVQGAADVLIVARGGGSKEDLMAFNDERVVRAVAGSRVPTISAVGHEVDVTLTDLAADLRAATPSQAAELVVARREDFEGLLGRREREMASELRGKLNATRAGLERLLSSRAFAGYPARAAHAAGETAFLSRALFSAMGRLPLVFGERLARAEAVLVGWPARAALPHLRTRIDQEERALADRMTARLAGAHESLGVAAGRLDALNPLRVLARGYSVTYREGEAAPLIDAAAVKPGDALRIRLAKGEIGATVVRSVHAEETNR